MRLADGGKPIRVGDTSYIYKGVFNPIYWIGDKPYRPRVETLVIKDGSQVYIYFYPEIKYSSPDLFYKCYELPGGSIDIDSNKIQQAENEVNEEALITVKDMYDTGISYYQLYKPGFLESGGDSPLEYYGSISDIFIGIYSGEYDKSLVKEEDLAPEIAEQGKFYDIKDIAKYLRKEHLQALLASPYIKDDIKAAININRTDNISESINHFINGEPTLEGINYSLIMELKEIYNKEDYGLPDRKAFPMPDEKHVKSAIKFFNYARNKEEEKELADNINKKIRKFKMTNIKVGKKNKFSKYYKPLSENLNISDYCEALKIVQNKIHNESSKSKLYPLYEQAKNIIRMMIDGIETGMVDTDSSIDSFIESCHESLIQLTNNQLSLSNKVDNRSIKFKKILESVLHPVMEADDEDGDDDDVDYNKIADEDNGDDEDDDGDGVDYNKIADEDDDDGDDGEDNDYNKIADDGDDTETDNQENEESAPDTDDEDDGTTADIDTDDGGRGENDDNDGTGDTDYNAIADSGDSNDEHSEEDGGIADDDDSGSGDDEDAESGDTDITDSDGSDTDDTDDTDYDAIADDGDSSTEDDTDTESDDDDDTGDDTSDDDTETEENSNRYDNKELKNFLLMQSFLSAHETVVDILDSVTGIVLPTPVANGILAKVVKNLQTIKVFIEKFIQFQFNDNDYAFNLYYYNVIANALRLNLKLLKTAVEDYENKNKK